MAAERATVDRLIAHHLADKIGASFEGRVQGVTKAGLFVSLAPYGADGFIPISTLGDDYYHYDETNHALSGERSGKGFRLGDNVEVRLVEALPVAGALRFEMLTEPHPVPERRALASQGDTLCTQRPETFSWRVARQAGRPERSRMTEQLIGKSIAQAKPHRPVGQAMWRGFLGRCPHCGQGKLFRAFVKSVDNCSVCGEDYTHHQADDFPAYITIIDCRAYCAWRLSGDGNTCHIVELGASGNMGTADDHHVARVAPAGKRRDYRLAMGKLHARVWREQRSKIIGITI